MTELVRTYKLTDSGAWGWVTEEAEGGGGSLPDWWTVDSTPDQERVTFNGGVQSLAPAGYGGKIVDFGDEEGNTEFVFDKDGLQFWLEAAKVLDIDHVGAVTISPSDPDALALLVKSANTPDDGSAAFQVQNGDDDKVFEVASDGSTLVQARAANVALLVKDADGSTGVRLSANGRVVIDGTATGVAPLTLLGLPTADPTVVGQLWNDTGTVKVSAG